MTNDPLLLSANGPDDDFEMSWWHAPILFAFLAMVIGGPIMFGFLGHHA